MKSYRYPIQSEMSECGLACVAVCLNEFGSRVELRDLRATFGVSQRGTNVRDVAEICSAVDLVARVVACDLDELAQVRTPAILHWNFNHFVVMTAFDPKRGATIVDPAAGECRKGLEELGRCFTGVLLEVSLASTFRKKAKESGISLLQMVSFRHGLSGAIAKSVALSLFLQLYVLASPFFIQLAVDDAALKGDLALLTTLALGFGLFAIFNSTAEYLRSVTTQFASALVGWQLSTRLFHHMLRLPLQWFQSRRLADTLSRFDSLEPIKALVSGGLISAVFDGLLAISLLGMMAYYSMTLALASVAAVAISVASKLLAIRPSMGFAMDALQAGIAEKGKRIETIRSMQTIKSLGGEQRRESDWAARMGEAVSAGQKSALLAQGVKSWQGLVENLAGILVVYLAVKSTLSGAFSIGMLYAFVSYRQQFSSRTLTLVDQVVSWRMLEMHSRRLADVAFQPREECGPRPEAPRAGEPGAISLSHVSFRYSPRDAEILRDIHFEADPGEFVAIVGKSGSGKSTLMKILSGLYTPTTGIVRLGNSQAAGLQALRASVGCVLQDDELLAGSLLENVTFFEDQPDVQRAWRCLEMASMKAEVEAMPMQLHTLVGDVGASLSGGQRQRVLLARALYREPGILLLDEATSNLDPATDAFVYDKLAGMKVTRIVVTHRPATAKLADRVYLMERGTLVPLKRGEHAGRAVGMVAMGGLEPPTPAL